MTHHPDDPPDQGRPAGAPDGPAPWSARPFPPRGTGSTSTVSSPTTRVARHAAGTTALRRAVVAAPSASGACP